MSGFDISPAIKIFALACAFLLQTVFSPFPALAVPADFGHAGAVSGSDGTEHSFLTAERFAAGPELSGDGLLAMGGKGRGRDMAPDGSGAADNGGNAGDSLFRSALEGSFLGALLFGYPFEDLGLPDLAILALLGFLLVWRFMPGPRPGKNQEGDRFTVGRRDRSSTELPRDLQPKVPRDADRKAPGQRAGQSGRWPADASDSRKDGRREAENDSDGQERAPFRPRSGAPENAWTRRRTDAATPAGAAADAFGASPAGEFDQDDFLEGARVLYIRMQEAWAERDAESLAPFMTPDMMRLLREQAAADPHPVGMHIMLLNADLIGLERQNGEERAGVKFSVLTRTDRDAPIEIHEIWHFVRRGNTGGTWRLAGIEEHEEQQ